MNRKIRICTLLAALILALAGTAAAEQQLILPDGGHIITLPDGLSVLPRDAGTAELYAVYGKEDLELEVFIYPGNGRSVEENAQALADAGREAEIREVGGVSMLCYREMDEADGALCIGYMYPVNGAFVELSFWYASEAAAAETVTIMNSFRELP